MTKLLTGTLVVSVLVMLNIAVAFGNSPHHYAEWIHVGWTAFFVAFGALMALIPRVIE